MYQTCIFTPKWKKIYHNDKLKKLYTNGGEDRGNGGEGGWTTGDR